MKVFVSMVTAVGFLFAVYVAFEISSLRDDCNKLSAGVESATFVTQELAAARQKEEGPARWDDLNTRLTRLEEQLSAPVSDEGSPDEAALATIRSTLEAQGEEIAALRKDLAGVRRVRGALDETADRVLGAVGQEGETREGGLERLMEMGALFRKSPDELTEEELARRDEIATQLRRRRDEWAIRAFDRRLEVKLDDQQKEAMQQLLADEATALEAYRNQELTDEQKSEGRKQIREQTDQRAAGVLSAEQYESWKGYRSRSGGRSLRLRPGR
jgi:hypothetical protein